MSNEIHKMVNAILNADRHRENL